MKISHFIETHIVCFMLYIFSLNSALVESMSGESSILWLFFPLGYLSTTHSVLPSYRFTKCKEYLFTLISFLWMNDLLGVFMNEWFIGYTYMFRQLSTCKLLNNSAESNFIYPFLIHQHKQQQLRGNTHVVSYRASLHPVSVMD